MVFVYVTVFGIGFGAFAVAYTGLFSVYYGQTPFPSIIGFTTPFTIVGFVGAPVAGAIYDATGSYSLPFSIGLIALLACLVCFFFARPPRHPTQGGQ